MNIWINLAAYCCVINDEHPSALRNLARLKGRVLVGYGSGASVLPCRAMSVDPPKATGKTDVASVTGRAASLPSGRPVQISTCSEIAKASSMSMPKYRTVLSILVWPSKSCTARKLPVRR